jgi:dTDP-4-dehydrorhamnose reductase
MKRPILLTGKTGQVGSELLRLLPPLGEVVAPDRRELDLLDANSIRRVVREIRPEIIVNAAAYTTVDGAETQKAEAAAINAGAPAIFAEEAKKIGAVIVHYSTDYIFDGSKSEPYEEKDLANPINVYGKTKFAGEQAIRASDVPHLVLRTAWVYAMQGRNFLLTILRLAAEREELRIVRDQFGAPTCSRDIADATVKILTQLNRQGGASPSLSRVGGVYHLTAAGTASWYDFACTIIEEAAHISREVPWFAEATCGRPIIARRIVPITTAEFPTPASRPAYSVLSNARFNRTFGFALPDWRAQLRHLFEVERGAAAHAAIAAER